MNIRTKINPYQEQIMRLSSLQKFPLHPQGVTELRDALRKNAGTMDRAEVVIDKVIAEKETCPTPRELSSIAQEIIRQREAAPMGCEICQGQPWITVQKHAKDPSLTQYMADGSQRCDCTLGLWFRQKDRENQVKREQGLPV